MVLVVLLGIHNLSTVVVQWRTQKIKIHAIIGVVASVIWSVLFLLCFFGNFGMYSVLVVGYICAVYYNLKIFRISEDKGRLSKVILCYNFVGVSVVLLKMLSGNGIDFTGVFSWVSHVLTLSHSLFHMINFSFLQIFYPTLFIPPILLYSKKPQKKLQRLGINIVKVFAGYTVCFIVIAGIFAGIMISSFSDIPVFAEDYTETPMKFGVKVNSFANESLYLGDWEELLSKEIEIAEELGLDYLDFYVDRSYLEDSEKKQELQKGLNKVRDKGFCIILACMGSPDWIFNPPSRDVHDSTMWSDAVTLAELHPDYLILVVEPFARHNGMMLQHPLSVEEWSTFIDTTASDVKLIDENIKVAVTIAAAEGGGLPLFQTLQTSNVDAVGIDIHPFHADMVDIIYEYSQAANPEKEVWVFEFGMETYNFGEETQAKYMSYLPKIASDLNFSGVVQYDIMDNPQSQLGLVYTNGERKLGFYAYKNAIQRIRGNPSDFSQILKEKQKDNGVFVIFLILALIYIGLKKVKKW